MRLHPKTGKVLAFKKFFYLESDSKMPFFVKHHARPSGKNTPENGAWVMFAWNGVSWGNVGTIQWKDLSKHGFVGREG